MTTERTTTPDRVRPHVDVRRSADRFASPYGWLDSHHSFSFGQHYDPANTHHGLLLVNNDDVVDAGTGFDTHPHRDMEIVTWVLRRLPGAPGLHRPPRDHLPRPGPADERRPRHPALGEERLLAPRAATPHDDPVHFVQMWVVPDESGITPGYEQLEIDGDLLERQPRAGRLRHGRARRTTPRSGSATSTPPCTPRASSPARASSCPRRRSCTCSCPAARSCLEGAGPLGTGDAVRFTAHRWPARHRRPSRPRSWCGRCTPPSRPEPPRHRHRAEETPMSEHNTEAEIAALHATRDRLAATYLLPSRTGARPRPAAARTTPR